MLIWSMLSGMKHFWKSSKLLNHMSSWDACLCWWCTSMDISYHLDSICQLWGTVCQIFLSFMKLFNHQYVFFRCIMALIRGLNSHCPCPVCLILGDCLSDLSKIYPLRTTETMRTETMRAVYEEVQEARTVAEKQEILKEYGLHNVKVSQDTRPHNFSDLALESNCRMFFGCLRIQTSIQQYHGIDCMPIMVAYSPIICSFQGNYQGFGETILWKFWHLVESCLCSIIYCYSNFIRKNLNCWFVGISLDLPQ